MNPFNSEKANQGSTAKFSQVSMPIEQILSSILIRRKAKRDAAMKTDARIDSVTGQGEEKSHTESEPASEFSPRLLNSQPGGADSSGHAIGIPSPSSSGLQVAGMKRGNSEVTLGGRGLTGKKSKLASVAASYSEGEISRSDENEDDKLGSELEEDQKDDLDPEFSAAELAKMYHWQLADKLRDILDDKEQVQSSDKNREGMIKITEVMEKKFREATHPNEKSKPKKAPRTECPVKEEDYLREFSGKEEDNHPFMPKNLYQNGTIPTFPPLARSWDSKSKAKITDSKVGFLSGASGWVEKGTLDTAKGRMESIARHCNWRSRMQTIFIPTTTDWKDIFYDRMPQ
ncbi:hypothetical protein B0O99DRAFT_744706 [Bisporella sp. PMI_857]|nr:hypothetical protein B0O99DRAFT_744706 [Bisporella sp. PMI_857]